MNSQWNIGLIYKMIDLYRERPELWDNSMEKFKDRDKKNAAWNEISRLLKIEREIVERKMRILIFQFRRELLQRNSSSDENSKWFAFKKMLFLKAKWAQLNKPRGPNGPPENETGSSLPETSARRKTPVYNKTAFEYIIENPISMTPTTSQRRHEDDKSNEGSSKMSRDNFDRLTRDEFTIFGEYVATKLRKLDNSFASCTAQYHINNILYNADIGKYNKNESEPSRSIHEICKTEHPDEDVMFEKVDVP